MQTRMKAQATPSSSVGDDRKKPKFIGLPAGLDSHVATSMPFIIAPHTKPLYREFRKDYGERRLYGAQCS